MCIFVQGPQTVLTSNNRHTVHIPLTCLCKWCVVSLPLLRLAHPLAC